MPKQAEMRAYEPSLRESIAWFFADRAADLGADRSLQQYIADKIGGAVDLAPAIGEVLGLDDAYRDYMAGNYGDMLVTLGATAMGAVPVVGDAAGKAAKEGFRAFHGSRADFNAFDKAKIGTGAGTGEGRGVYLSADKDYASRFKGDEGKLFEVNVRATPDDFFDLDAPLKGQSPAVRQAFEKAFSRPETSMSRPLPGQVHGNQSTRMVTPEFSKVFPDIKSPDMPARMQEAGFKGLTYRDQGKSGDVSKNFVVFDPGLIDIVSKYGIAGATAVLGYDVLSGLSEAQAAELESYAPSPGVDPMTTESTKKGGAVNDFTSMLLGEAGGRTPEERYNDMLHIASVVANRAEATGKSVEDIISAPGEFSAWGKALPPGVEKYSELAQKAINQVATTGPVTSAQFYATPKATGNLPKGLVPQTQTTAHQYFSDPRGRAIETASGYVRPQNIPAIPASVPVPTPRPETTAGGRNIVPGLGLQNLVPSTIPGIIPNMGPMRPNLPDESIMQLTRDAVSAALGPRHMVSLISGRENEGDQYGSIRHGTGKAADIQVIDPTGRIMNMIDDKQALTDVAQAANALGAKGTGFGTDYMAGRGMHIDTVTPDPRIGQGFEWGNLGNANAGLLAEARQYALMPASFYERNLPQTMAPPVSRGSYLTPAPVPQVERGGPLPPAGIVPFSTLPPLPSDLGLPRETVPPAAPAVNVPAPPVPAPPPVSQPVMPAPPMPPMPTPAPRGNPARSLAGGLLGPAMQQIGANLKSNIRGDRIGMFAGIPQAYRSAFQGLAGMFSGKPSYAGPFNNIGSGYGAIGNVFGAQTGTSAYSNDGSRFTSLGNGYVERTNPDYGWSVTLAPGEYDPGSGKK